MSSSSLSLSQQFPDHSGAWYHCLFPYALDWWPSLSAKTMVQMGENEENAFHEGNYCTCCKLAIDARIRHMARAVFQIPLSFVYSFGECIVSIACFSGVVGGGAALTGAAALVLSDGNCDEGCDVPIECLGGCCLIGTACLAMSCWSALFCLYSTARCPGNLCCLELQNLCQPKIDLFFSEKNEKLIDALKK